MREARERERIGKEDERGMEEHKRGTEVLWHVKLQNKRESVRSREGRAGKRRGTANERAMEGELCSMRKVEERLNDTDYIYTCPHTP